MFPARTGRLEAAAGSGRSFSLLYLGFLGALPPGGLDLFPLVECVGCLEGDAVLGDDLSVGFVGVEAFVELVQDELPPLFPQPGRAGSPCVVGVGFLAEGLAVGFDLGYPVGEFRPLRCSFLRSP